MKNYVTEYMGHKVPEGSAHYNHENAFFYNKTKILCFDTRAHSRSWAKTVFHRVASEAVELPEAKWEPAVGEECEVWHGEEWMKCLFIGRGLEDHYIYQLTEVYRFELNGDHDLKAFRPLKTQHEKDREAFFEKALVVSKKLSIDDFLSELFDVGFTAPKEAN
jgi:hypothetical protein